MAENDLITHLQNPRLYEHPIKYFRVIETHLSWVLLTGLYAYKIKKPVHFSFVDFSTLEKRKFFCEEELRLNHRLSGFLYLGLIAITGSKQNPQVNGSGPVLEYALKMEEFNQDQLFSFLVLEKAISFPLMEKLAHKIADFHVKAETVPAKSGYGNLESIQKPMEENFQECRQRTKNKSILQTLKLLEKFSLQQFETLKPIFIARKNKGHVKDCHGDLHLGNIVLLHHLPIIFDCLEFNVEFRCVDVINEIAFLTMDLKQNKAPLLATFFLNHYLSYTGDYAGLQLLLFYEIYRAMVRAKVALFSPEKSARRVFANYVKLAEKLMNTALHAMPCLIITQGVSGSGKTMISELLALELNAIHLRSDIERKRLLGNVALKTLYSNNATEQTHLKLVEMSTSILKAGYSVIVDASFLKQINRKLFIQLAKKFNCPFVILQFEASHPTLKNRIISRSMIGKDASDATPEVLDNQLINREPLNRWEKQHSVTVNTEKEVVISGLIKKIAKIISS